MGLCFIPMKLQFTLVRGESNAEANGRDIIEGMESAYTGKICIRLLGSFQ